jgi:plasmid stabilization system protein ParE
MTDRFRLTKPAIQDIEEIADYIAQQSGLEQSERFLSKLESKFCELPALNWSTSMRGASKIEGNRLDSSRLTPILFWSYIASLGSNAGSQRQ